VVREVRAMKDDHAAAELIIAWLRDTNAIQRDVVKTAAGKTEMVAEHDLSGGLTALLNLLRSEAPIPRRVRDALVFALDPRGGSLLQLKKRARRAPGRPSADSSVKDAVHKAYDVMRHPDAVEATIKKRRPIRACGIPPRKVTTDEIISALDVSRSEHYRRMSGAKSMKSRTK
jgi:hypothetical protein